MSIATNPESNINGIAFKIKALFWKPKMHLMAKDKILTQITKDAGMELAQHAEPRPITKNTENPCVST